MAQSRFPLQIKRSKEEGLKPGILAEGEPAVNLKDKVLYIGMEDGEVIGINAGLPHRTKLKLDTKLKIRQDEGVVVPGRYEITENGELTIEDGGVFVVLDDKDEEEKIYAYDSQRLGNIPAEDYFDYLNPQRFNSLYEAINAIGSANKDFLIKGNVIVDADLTIPENVNLVFTRNGKITVNSGVTLTINGGIQAGSWQIFDGDGEVTGNPKIEAAYPEWFGAKGDGETGDSIAIQKAEKLIQNFQGKLIFSSGKRYLLDSCITIDAPGIKIQIDGDIIVGNDDCGFLLDLSPSYLNNKWMPQTVIYGNGKFEDTDNLGCGIKVLGGFRNFKIMGLQFKKLQNWCIYLDATNAPIERWEISNLLFIGPYGAIKVYAPDDVLPTRGAAGKISHIRLVPRETGTTTPDDTYGIWIENHHDLDIVDVEGGSTYEALVLKGNCHGYLANISLTANGPRPTFLFANSDDGTKGPRRILATNLYAFGYKNAGCTYGFVFESRCDEIFVTNLRATGYIEAGVKIEDGAIIRVSNMLLCDNYGNGLLMEGGLLFVNNLRVYSNNRDDKTDYHDIKVNSETATLTVVLGQIVGDSSQDSVYLPATNNVRFFMVGYANTGSGNDFTNEPKVYGAVLGPSDFRIKSDLNIEKKFYNGFIVTFPDGDTTPSVADSNIFKTNNSSATSITTFDDGLAGQEITVIFGDSNTTIVHGSGIYLKGGANVTPSANTTMKFVYDGTYWYEV